MGVAIATMVSSVANIGREPREVYREFGEIREKFLLPDLPDLPVSSRYFTEMMTVFSNASPMLSEETDSTSPTARWTIRRS